MSVFTLRSAKSWSVIHDSVNMTICWSYENELVRLITEIEELEKFLFLDNETISNKSLVELIKGTLYHFTLHLESWKTPYDQGASTPWSYAPTVHSWYRIT